MSLRRLTIFCLSTFLLATLVSPVRAIVIAEFDFETVDGTTVPNPALGVDGVLTENATVADGVLKLENVDLSAFDNAIDATPHGMLLPFGRDNPFGGASDWSVTFEFSVEEGASDTGALFTSDGGLCDDGCNDDVQAGSLNIFMGGGGQIIADGWYIGAIATAGELNDGLMHQVKLSYTAGEDGLWELFLDRDISESEDTGGLELADQANWPYIRDSGLDRAGVGFVTNPDFGFEIDAERDGIAAVIDNLIIEGTPAPDLNQDGQVSVMDWVIFVDQFSSDLTGKTQLEAFLAGDLNGDGVHGAADFIAFRSAFVAANDGGAEAASIPEPGSMALFGIAGVALLSLLRVRRSLATCAPALLALTTAVVFLSADPAQAQLAEYLFENGTADTSGNNRDGELEEGFGNDVPEVSGGVLKLPGVEDAMLIPLGDANPFDGATDFTIDISFKAGIHPDEAGHVLFSSADADDPEAGPNHSMALFIGPGGDIIYDNFFVGEARVSPPSFVIGDDQMHDLRVTYVAPEDLGEDPDEPNPGVMFMRLDGQWFEAGEIAPNVPGIDNHEVLLGSTRNLLFPFECEINDDGDEECFTRSFLGELDNVRVFDEAIPPSEMTAEVNRANGNVTFHGGEFGRELNFYELSSDAGALNAEAWASGNLDSQNLNSEGDGDGQTWDTLLGTPERLVEAFLTGGTLLTDGESITLPGAWNGAAEDLALEIVTTSNQLLDIEISYVGEGTGNQGGGGMEITLANLCSAADPDAALATLGLIKGDIDGDGEVAFLDFLALANNFGSEGATYEEGDIDCDGSVAFLDFLALANNFGQTSGGAAASIPEPSTGVMLWSVALIGLRWRKRSSR